jgi:transposase-like protein
MGVRWSVAYALGYRHVEELREKRGPSADHATVTRWVLQDSPSLAAAWHRASRRWKLGQHRLCG